MRNYSTQGGFSLVEIMIAIVILGLVLALVGTNVLQRLETARMETTKNQIRLFQSAILEFYAQEKRMPTEEEGLRVLAEKGYLGSSGGETTDVPLDPWDNEYMYKSLGGRKFEIKSYGADGAEGGEGSDADISSLELGKHKPKKEAEAPKAEEAPAE